MTHGPPVRRKNSNAEDDDSDMLPPPPDGGWGWVVVFGSFFIHVITDGMTYSFGIFYKKFLDYFGEGKGYTALIVSLLVGVTLCSGPISSSFVNKYGCRAVTIAGAMLAAVCLIVSAFANNVLTLIFTIGIGTGLGLGLIYLPAIVSVTMYFEKYRSLATGIAVCGSGFGTFIFAPLTDGLITNYGWRGGILIISGIVLNCMIFGALFRPLEPIKKSKQQLHSIMEEDEEDHGQRDKRDYTDLDQYKRNNNTETNGIPSSDDDADAYQFPRSQSVGHNLATKKYNTVGRNGKMSSKQLSPPKPGIRTTLSQPMLMDSNEQTPLKESHKPHLHGSGTMYRPDILYQGSLYNIPQYKSHLELHGSHASCDFSSLRHDRHHSTEDLEQNVLCCGCIPCSKETCDTFEEMMNFSLFKDVVFIIFVVSNFCTSIGFNVPYVYMVAHAEGLGINSETASYLLAITGIANTVGRIILGYIADKPWVNRLLVYNVCLTICGLATALSIFATDMFWLSVYASVFGFTIGAYVGLTSVILVDLLGLEKLTNAFGLLLLFQGFASLIGPPAAGTLYDILNSYKPGFLLAGVMIAISGVMLFAIPPLQRKVARKSQHQHELQGGLIMSS